MNCFEHAECPAVALCSNNCGRGLCPACARGFQPPLCSHCAEEVASELDTVGFDAKLAIVGKIAVNVLFFIPHILLMSGQPMGAGIVIPILIWGFLGFRWLLDAFHSVTRLEITASIQTWGWTYFIGSVICGACGLIIIPLVIAMQCAQLYRIHRQTSPRPRPAPVESHQGFSAHPGERQYTEDKQVDYDGFEDDDGGDGVQHPYAGPRGSLSSSASPMDRAEVDAKRALRRARNSYEAGDTKDAAVQLRAIIDEFPGSTAAQFARRNLDTIVKRIRESRGSDDVESANSIQQDRPHAAVPGSQVHRTGAPLAVRGDEYHPARCPQCDAGLKIPHEVIGQRIRCLHCSFRFIAGSACATIDTSTSGGRSAPDSNEGVAVYRSRCPHCGAELKLSAQVLGRRVRCLACNARFTASTTSAEPTVGSEPTFQ